ncbi:MAG: NAD-dependent epimerase/dehydratase family protein [Conexivisphaerales archaeon]
MCSRKILVTGATGYVGSRLAKLLVENCYDVTCMERFFFGKEPLAEIDDEIKIIRDDIRSFDGSLLNDIDTIFDLASLSNDPSGELEQKKRLDANPRRRRKSSCVGKGG